MPWPRSVADRRRHGLAASGRTGKTCAAGAQPGTANCLHALTSATFQNLRQGILDFDAASGVFCQMCGVPFIAPEFLPSDPMLFFDGTHMTDLGYSALARCIAPQVARAARELEQNEVREDPIRLRSWDKELQWRLGEVV